MADEKPPMSFGAPPRPRDPAAEFARMPVDPEVTLESGGSPGKWVPGLGVATAPQKRGKIDWPPAKAPPTPFRNMQQGRK